MGDDEHKVGLARQVEAELLEKQRAHVRSFEELESQGLDRTVIVEIFGTDVLRSDVHESRAVLGLLQRLYGAFSGENRHAAVLCTVDQMAPGCHGFGGRVEYDRKAVLRIYSGALSHDQIKYVPKALSESGEPEVTVDAPSVTILTNGERRDSFAPSTLLSRDAVLPGLEVPAWVDGSFINMYDGHSQIQIFGSTDVSSLFKEADAHIRTTTSPDTHGVGMRFYDSFDDWIEKQDRP